MIPKVVSIASLTPELKARVPTTESDVSKAHHLIILSLDPLTKKSDYCRCSVSMNGTTIQNPGFTLSFTCHI